MIGTQVDTILDTSAINLSHIRSKNDQSEISQNGNIDEDRGHQDANQIFTGIRLKNFNNIIIAYLNINSFVSKYDALKTIIPNNVDIMVVGETKLDDSYATSQFNIAGYSYPFRLNRDKHGGGLLIYVRELYLMT